MADILTDEEIDALLCEEGEKSCMRHPFVYFLLRQKRKLQNISLPSSNRAAWEIKMFGFNLKTWIRFPYVYFQGRMAHWALDHFLKKNRDPASYHPEALTIMNRVYDHDYLELFTKHQMIQKLILLAKLGRREGIHDVQEQLRRYERMPWFIEQYESNLAKPEDEVSTLEFSTPYLEAMEQKMTRFVEELVAFFHSENYLATKFPYNIELLKNLPPRESFTNVNKRTIEEYTLEELSQKVSFYTDLFFYEHILAGEKHASEELNPFIKRVLMSVIDGYGIDELRERAMLDIRCKMNQHTEMCELIEVGFKGVFQGENPRGLEEKLLFFIEEGERKSMYD